MTTSLQVLLITRSDLPVEPLEAELRRQGFLPRFESASTKAEFLRALDLDLDLILTELDPPQLPLRDMLRQLHARGHDVPVIVLVDPAREREGPEAVRLGARDYVLTDHPVRLGPATTASLERRRLEQDRDQHGTAPAPAETLFVGWFQNSPFGLGVTEPDGTLLQVNPALLRLCGYAAGAAPRLRDITRLLDPPESVRRILRDLKASQTPHQTTLHLKLAEEGTREALVTAVSLETPDGERVLWTVEDIADWVQAERSLQESRTEMAEIFDAALDGILMLDAGQRILLVNPAAERIFGLASPDLVARPVGDVLRLEPGPPTAAGVNTPPRRLPAGGMILTGVRALEHQFPAEATISRFRLRGEERFVVVVRDITDRKAAEDALRESEAGYRGIFEGVQDAIEVQDLDGRILDVNRRACELYGYDHDRFVQLTVRDLVRPGAEPVPGDLLLQPATRGSLREALDRRSDGTLFPVQISASLHTIGGNPRVLVVVRDITEAKRAEEEIRRRAAHLEALNTIIAGAAAPVDVRSLLELTVARTLEALRLDTGCAWAGDDQVCSGSLTERDPSLLLRMHAGLLDTQGFVAIRDWAAVQAGEPRSLAARDALATGLRSSLTVPIPLTDRVFGGIAVASNEPHEWTEEEVALVQAVAHQIGGAVHRLQLLHWTQGQARQLQTVLDNAPEGFLVLDGTRHVRVANPLAEEYLACLGGYDEAGNLSSLGSRPLSALLAPASAGRLHQTASSDEPPRIFDILISPILLDLETQGWVVTLREVTDQQRLLQEADQHRNLAAIGRMAAGIAHDFNNVLGPILLHSEMLRRDGALPDRARSRLATIQEQAQRAADLVQQILDFSRKTIMERRPIELGAFLDGLLSLLRRTMPENISLSFTREGDAFPVRADSGRLQQVILNLAANARDAMPDGGHLHIDLKETLLRPGGTRPLPEVKPGAWVCLVFEDTGPGIPPEDLPYLFEPFYTTKGAGGTGLGLAQAFGIVRQHDGFILAESPPSGGARFTIYLPLDRGPFEEPAAPELQALEQGHGERILIVEDNVATRQALCEILEMLNYQTIEAENGRVALEILESRPDIALVISDMVMPEMGGKALHEMIRTSHPSVRVILMTGYPLGEEDRLLLTRRGVVWLGKPVGPEILAQQIRRVLTAQP